MHSCERSPEKELKAQDEPEGRNVVVGARVLLSTAEVELRLADELFVVPH